MDMDKFFYDLELELEVLMTRAEKDNEKRYITVEGVKYSSMDLIAAIKGIIGKAEGEEKLDVDFGNGFKVFLDQNPESYRPVDDKSPYVNIHKPGRYIVDYREPDNALETALSKLKEAWGKLCAKEQVAFITGLESAKLSADKDPMDSFF